MGRYGLLKNRISSTVYLDEVMGPGRYFRGFWFEALTFPSVVQTIQFSFEAPEEGVQHLQPLHVRSKNAIPMHLEISAQYQLSKNELPMLFKQAMTPTLQEDLFISALRAELTKVMSLHLASDCWERRTVLVEEFTRACERRLALYHVKCWGLQFYRSRMDDKYETALVKTQVQKQQERIEQARKRATRVRSETEVVLADYKKNITVVLAKGDAQRYNVWKNAQADAESRKISAESTALNEVQTRVRLGNGTGQQLSQSQVAEYQKYLLMSQLNHPQLYYGLKSGSNAQYIAVGGGSKLTEVDQQALAEQAQDLKLLQSPSDLLTEQQQERGTDVITKPVKADSSGPSLAVRMAKLAEVDMGRGLSALPEL